MVAKACRTLWRPATSGNVTVGDTVECKLQIGNCGDISAPFGSSIEKDGVEIAKGYYDMIAPGKLSGTIQKSFVMPNSVTKLKYEGYSWQGDHWSLDVNFIITLTPKVVAEPKACIVSYKPDSQEVVVGTEVTVENKAENCGDAGGVCYVIVKSDTLGDVAPFEQEWLRTWWDTVKTTGSFTMPNRTVKLYFCYGHWDGSSWIEDGKKTITLTVKVVYCNQAFKVVDKDTGAVIPGVTIKLNEPPLTSCYTNSYGKCSITNLVVGWGLSVTVTKSGYITGSDSFTACTAERTIRLEKEISYCNQPFKVIDKATGAVIPGVTIKLNEPPLTSCYTNSYGKCSITNLRVGWGLSVTVTKSGYVTGSDSFTACTGERTIRLEKEITECEYTGYASAAKIELGKSEVPESTIEGETVNVKIVVDNTSWSRDDPTRYRVKFAWDDIVEYSDDFTLTGRDAWGGDIEQDVLYSFTMPNHSITLAVEIERCNAEGNWEPAGLEYKKDYSISVVPVGVCKYTGYASDGKFEKGKWVYPERALKNTPVNIKIISDSIEVKLGSTRYKVIVTQEWDGKETDLPAFLLGYIGEHDDTYSFTMPEEDASLTAKLYRCNADGQWELCPHADATHTITITEGYPEFNWICWTLTDALVPNITKAVVAGRATIQAGIGGCLVAHRVDGIVPITIKNLTSGKEMTQNTDAEGYLEFEFPFADCVDGVNEFQLVSGDILSKKKSVDTREEIAIGKIISCQTEVPAGDYGVLGWDLKVPVRIQNQGGATGEFRVYFMNITTGKKEDVDPPDTPVVGWWGNIKPDKTKEYTLESSSVLTEGMELEMQLWQQEKWEAGGEPDDVVKITVIEEVKPPIEIPKKLILYSGATIGCYAVGSMLPEKYGKPVKLVSIIPAILTGVEGYKIIKEKIPAWLK